MATNNNPLQCPLTQTIMREPVLGTDGYTYEKNAIIAHLQKHGTSPKTLAPMTARTLLPNRAIADLLPQQNDVGLLPTEIDGTMANLQIDGISNSTTAITQPKDRFSHSALATMITDSTSATLHIIPSTKMGVAEPLSARVHIQTPNPTQSEVESNLTTPNHVCCVIDISGSMNTDAVSKDEHGDFAENVGLSILDIVKFSTLVIAESLGAIDKLSIVTYSDDAKTVLEPIYMTDAGKTQVKTTLASIITESQTNLFAGLQCGIEQAHAVGNGYINSVLVLTDGYPNIHPDLGYEPAMAQVLADTPLFGALSTFGFGYHLDSKVLVDVSTIGGGYYSFIPDAGMVGTCFINALANSRCAFGVHPLLRISGCDFNLFAKAGIIPLTVARRNGGTKNLTTDETCDSNKERKNNGEIVGGLTLDTCLETSLLEGDIYIKLTPLRYGSNVDVMLKPLLFQENRDIKIELVFETIGGMTNKFSVEPADGNAADELFHCKRAQFVENAFNMSFSAHDNCKGTIFVDAAATEENSDGNSALDALYQDMRGQATEAITPKFNFDTWGKHFLLSLSTAHLHQFCNNFKDPGVQIYGAGLLFSSLQDTLDDIFERVPPAVPTHTTIGKGRSPVMMSTLYNNRNAACVHGKTLVTVKTRISPEIHEGNDVSMSLPNSSLTKISNIPICYIQKGDLVLTADGTYAKVNCLVETVVDNQYFESPFELIQVGQLCVTPYHPVKLSQQSGWQFPIQILNSKWMASNDDHYAPAYSVYNLILESGQRHKAVLMDGIESITLGHGITNNSTLKHSYFGTDEIISDLEIIQAGSGGKAGHIVIKESYIKRDAVSGRICRISETKVGVEETVATVNETYSCVPCAA
mmetsp:Transcript_4610/g.5330  ORF Transcript_4610/g.5330 Transcript_4610/m.5330 type:complete len:867 (+) Transcript_4610:69-2669(+)